MKIKRSIYKQLADDLNRSEVSIILGPRQVGKTFLLKELENDAKARGLRTRYYNLELPHDLLAFNKDDRDLFRMLTDDLDVVFIDEFYYLPNASKIFKAVYDGAQRRRSLLPDHPPPRCTST